MRISYLSSDVCSSDLDAGAGLAALQQQLLARLQVVDRATGGEGGGDQSVLVLNVDDAELAAVVGIEHLLVAGRGGRDDLRVVDADLAGIDVADAVFELHRDRKSVV